MIIVPESHPELLQNEVSAHVVEVITNGIETHLARPRVPLAAYVTCKQPILNLAFFFKSGSCHAMFNAHLLEYVCLFFRKFSPVLSAHILWPEKEELLMTMFHD